MIDKQPIDIPFAQGLQQKVDPWRVDAGHFISLTNSIFQKQGLLQKRNGYGRLSALPDTSYTYLSTVNDNLVALGDNLTAFSKPTDTWLTQGPVAPMAVSTLPLIRNSLNQSQCDSAVAPNGLVCVVYTEVGDLTTAYKYAILDGSTGQNVVSPRVIPVSSGTVSGSPRVFLVGNFFVLVFTNTISGVNHLQYVAIPYAAPATTSPNLDVAPSYAPSQRLSWDGVVANTSLYVAYDTTTGGQSVNITYLTAAGFATAFTATPTNFAAPQSFKGYTATIMSVCADTTVSNPLVYLSWYAPGDGSYTAAVDLFLGVAVLPIQMYSTAVPVANLASAAQDGTCTIFYEVINSYGYDSSIPTNLISKRTLTATSIPVTFTSVFSSGASTITASSATGLVNNMFLVDNTTPGNIAPMTEFTILGTTLTLSTPTTGTSASSPGDTLSAQTLALGAPVTTARSVGLASKAWIYDGTIYVMGTYQSPYQNTYFMLNGSTSTQAMPVVTAKLAYENGGGYLSYGLPSVTVTNGTASVSYLYKDLIEASSTAVQNNSQQLASTPVYSQTGVNLGYLNLLEPATDAAEMATTLNFSGGFLWMYDGLLPVEQNFFLWPDSVEVSASSSSVIVTGNTTGGSNVITAVSSTTGLQVGMTLTAAQISGTRTVTALTANTITFSGGPASGPSTGENITLGGNIAAQPNGSTNTDAYYYQAVYEWTDNRGLIHRSAPSIPVAVTTTGTGSTYIFTVYVPTLRLTYKIASPVKITLYRWSAGQQTYYQVTSITQPLLNNTTVDYVTFVDAQSDAQILGNAIIYTTGGVLEDINAPATNIITTFDDRIWMVDAEDQNTWWYSKQVIEGTPVEMSDLLTYYIAPSTAAQGPTGPVTAGAPMDDKLISFKQNAIYYTNGTGPDNTGANSAYSQPIFITSTVGCANQQSIVFTDVGLMFQSDKGIWLLGRDLSTSYIGADVENFNSYAVLSAVNVPDTNQVRFTLSNGMTLMYDYFFRQWGTFEGVPAISSCIYEGLHTFINSYGQTYQETPGVYLDGGNPVLMSFTTSWLKLAGLQGYQRAYYFFLLGEYLSPHVLQLGLAYDYNPAVVQAPVIRPTNYSPPGGTDISESPAGQQSPAGGPSQVEAWRVFLSQQRCSAIQLSLQEFFDPSKGAQPGAGFTLSGLQLVAGVKNINRTQAAKHSVGG